MEIQAVNSKYLSANIPRDLNVDKYCCEKLTILTQCYNMSQRCHLTEYSITVTFKAEKI